MPFSLAAEENLLGKKFLLLLAMDNVDHVRECTHVVFSELWSDAKAYLKGQESRLL